MSKRISNIIVAAVFAVIIVGLSAAFVFTPKAAVSEAERRALATLPALTWKNVKSGLFFDGMENYLADGFFARDVFRGIKARFQTRVLFLKENNGIAEKNGYYAKIDTKLNTSSLKNAGEKLKKIYEKYLSGANVYLAIVPDKSYFFAEDYGYPSYDHASLTETVRAYLPSAEYIDLFSALTLDCYYKTDTHWRQEKIVPVARLIAERMGRVDAGDPLSSTQSGALKTNALYPFFGVYSGQSAMDPAPETLYYLTDDLIDGMRVFDFETKTYIPVYDAGKFDGSDGYDVYLSGAKPLLRIENPAAETDAELIVFRDSFGSSISPLLAKDYKSVTLVDIRYINPEILKNYISFDGKDVLFLYSEAILNNSFSFR